MDAICFTYNEMIGVCLLMVFIFLTAVLFLDRLIWAAYLVYDWWRCRKNKGMVGRGIDA